MNKKIAKLKEDATYDLKKLKDDSEIARKMLEIDKNKQIKYFENKIKEKEE